MKRRSLLQLPAVGLLPASGAADAAPRTPLAAEVREWNNKPTLFLNGRPHYACFYALTDCPGGRWTWEELPRESMSQFVDAGFQLFQVDLFLELIWRQEGPLDIATVQRQIRGILDLCPAAAVVIRWHVNAPSWWAKLHPGEWTRYANGDIETIERNTQVRILMDDLRRTPRVSLASKLWRDMATAKTEELLRRLAKTPEGSALAGIQVACGVYGEWHYWGFMRNEPDTSAPMQSHFDQWRRHRGRSPVAIPSVEERAATDDGIFRDPVRREAVIDYYRCQQELVAENILHFCRVVKQSWPRKLLAGTFYGYFFSMFERQATGGHLCLEQVLASPDVDYLSAPQAYGAGYRELGGSGITRGLVESMRLRGKLFLDEMDQTPSWKWLNNVDTAFTLEDVPADIAIIRRNVVESYARGMGLWYYDFGPANTSGWWADKRLMPEIRKLKETLERYHAKPYEPGGDVLFVFDTEVFYYTGRDAAGDPLTDPLAVNRAIASAWRSGAGIETIHLSDLARIDLARFRVVVLANTWLLSESQRHVVRDRLIGGGRHVVFLGPVGYCDGRRLSVDLVREATGLPVQRHSAPYLPNDGKPFAPHFTLEGEPPGLARRGNRWFATSPLTQPSAWRQLFAAARAHLYVTPGAVVHAGGGVVLVHSKDGGPHTITLRNGRAVQVHLPAKSSWLFDAATGEVLLG